MGYIRHIVTQLLWNEQQNKQDYAMGIFVSFFYYCIIYISLIFNLEKDNAFYVLFYWHIYYNIYFIIFMLEWSATAVNMYNKIINDSLLGVLFDQDNFNGITRVIFVVGTLRLRNLNKIKFRWQPLSYCFV